MKKILTFIINIFIAIGVTILSPILIWVALYRFGKVATLLDYGRLGACGETIRVETKKDNVLWEGKEFRVPKAIQHMNVHSYYVSDHILVIKVYKNDKKIARLEKELQLIIEKGEVK